MKLKALPLSDCAVQVDARDNVAVVKTGVAAGLRVALPDGCELELLGEVGPGNRFATRAIPAGAFVLQYGQPIGTSKGIAAGEPILRRNMTDEVPVVRELPKDLSNPPPDYVPESQRATFAGFRRPDGRTGTRNYVLVGTIST